MLLWIRWLIFLHIALLPAVDFDVVIIGASPIPMCEAIYQACSGKKVLLLDQWPQAGGAWKSITACGIPHADMGCHQLVGANHRLREFLEKYLGCTMVAMEMPLEPCSSSRYCPDFYFSKGCFELIHNLERIIARTDIVFLLNQRVTSVAVQGDGLEIQTTTQTYTTKKVITVPGSYFTIEGVPSIRPTPARTFKFWHLYLLVQDPMPPKFSYLNYSYSGISRCMNLTHFVGLTNSGQQLFVFQAYNERALMQEASILEDMKQRHLVDPSAFILKSDAYVYEQFPYNTSWHAQMPAEIKPYFEILETSAFGSMSRYLLKWEEAMRPFRDLFMD